MATVEFTRFWISPLADLEGGVGFRLASLSSEPQVTVEQRRYGNGRLRLASMPGVSQQTPVTLRFDTRDELEFLEAQQGATVLFRDPKGRRFYGYYADLKVSERAGLLSGVATLTPQELTVDEAV